MSAEPVESQPGRRWLTAATGIAMSALFGWLAARHVDWPAARAALASVQWQWVAGYVVVLCGIQGLRMVRWSLLLHCLGETRWRRSLSVGAVGLSAIFFLPMRLGETVRPVLIARRDGVRMGEAIATVVVERLVDGLLVGLMLLAVGVWVSDALPTAGTIRSAGLAVGGVFLGLTVGMLLAVRYTTVFDRLLARLLGRWQRLSERIRQTVSHFREALLTLGRTRHAATYVAITTGLWVVNGLSVYMLFQGFGFTYPVSCAFVVLSATAVGILVPAAPTSIGTFHFAVTWALSLYGEDPAVAFNFAVLFHLGQVSANFLVGVGGTLAGGISLRMVSGATRGS